VRGKRRTKEDATYTSRIEPHLGMPTADDLGLERELVAIGARVRGPVGEASYAERGVALADVAADRLEMERAVGLEVGHETDAMRGARRGFGTALWTLRQSGG
jgi:hypothetical protein